MKKMLAVLGSLLLVMSVNACAENAEKSQQQQNIAVVNVQQIFQDSPKIAELNKTLQGKFKARQDKLVASQKSLQDELDKFKKESPTMAQAERDKLQKKIIDDQSTLSKDATAFQQDLSAEQNKIMKGVLSDLNGVIASLAKKNSYTLVLDAQAVIYANDNANITKDVAKEFDKK